MSPHPVSLSTGTTKRPTRPTKNVSSAASPPNPPNASIPPGPTRLQPDRSDRRSTLCTPSNPAYRETEWPSCLFIFFFFGTKKSKPSRVRRDSPLPIIVHQIRAHRTLTIPTRRDPQQPTISHQFLTRPHWFSPQPTRSH